MERILGINILSVFIVLCLWFVKDQKFIHYKNKLYKFHIC